MYDVGFDGPSVLGWVLCGVLLLLGAARAVAVERHAAAGPAAGRPAVVRLLGLTTTLVLVALAAVLVTILRAGLG